MSSQHTPCYNEYSLALRGNSFHCKVKLMDTTAKRSCKTATIDHKGEMFSLKFKALTLEYEGSDWMVFNPKDSDDVVSLDEWIKVDSNEKGIWYDRSSLALSFRI